jgi:hypothetical protein
VTVVSPVKAFTMPVTWKHIREIDLNVIAVDASVCWRGDGDVFVLSVREAIEILHEHVFYHDFENSMEFHIVGQCLEASHFVSRSIF